MGMNGEDRRYEDRRRLVLKIGLCLALTVLLLLMFGLRDEYIRLQASGHQRQADWMLMWLGIAFFIVTPLILGIGWFFVIRVGRRVVVRMDEDFEASVAHLPHEEQMDARLRREWMKDNPTPNDPV